VGGCARRRFLDAAHPAWEFAAEDDIADAYITLCMHAGIAVTDVICCARLEEHSQTENHNEAAARLGKADRDSVKHLRTLSGLMTKAGYSHTPATRAECRRARPSRRGAARDSPPHARHGRYLSGTRRRREPSRLAAKLAANGMETSGSCRTPSEPIMPLTCRYAHQ
jgi:hypothetical protein